ncbi:Fur family transcriptional regulator [Pseudorhodoferax sp.]|uniref:Fur family transcriptional regulator n=1 Tax=Pseudorhodoferax sp. TaxID=1993553 RepID=UPI002DD63BAC|nr:transcriptional repressor [Pseudorhodoferax sp.]
MRRVATVADGAGQADAHAMLRRVHLRTTILRVAVLELLAEAAERPMTVEAMAQAMLRRGQPISVPTLYGAVRSLVEHGLVERSRMDGGPALCWIKERASAASHQVVCKICQRHAAGSDAELSAQIARFCAQHGFPLGGQSVLIQTQCADCLRAASSPRSPLPVLALPPAHP